MLQIPHDEDNNTFYNPTFMKQLILENEMVAMGYERRIVKRLFQESKEPLENLDQTIDVMYDPLRHKPVNDREAGLMDDL